jgi:sulfofructose kinase
MARVLAVGIVTWDLLFKVDAIPPVPTKVMAQDCVEVGGGMAASAAVAVARLGGEAHFWGRCGRDEVGDRIAEDLRREAVDVSRLKRLERGRSPISAILIDRRGERMVVPYYDPALDPSPDWLPVGEIAGFDAVMVDVRWPAGAERALGAARQAGRIALLDADMAPKPVLASLIPHASHIVFSEPALKDYAGESDLATALRRLSRSLGAMIGVTAGADGFYWLEGDTVRHVPAPRVEAVDTLAAGDVFHGAFALALAEGRSLADAGRFATIAASLKCRIFGSRRGCPSRAEVDAFSRGSP